MRISANLPAVYVVRDAANESWDLDFHQPHSQAQHFLRRWHERSTLLLLSLLWRTACHLRVTAAAQRPQQAESPLSPCASSSSPSFSTVSTTLLPHTRQLTEWATSEDVFQFINAAVGLAACVRCLAHLFILWRKILIISCCLLRVQANDGFITVKWIELEANNHATKVTLTNVGLRRRE